jgi:hypothetical protein
MTETKADYMVRTEIGYKHYFTCECGNVLGRIRDVGDIHALVIRGAVIMGDARICCDKCGRSRRWDYVRKNPAFVDRMMERREVIDNLIDEAREWLISLE